MPEENILAQEQPKGIVLADGKEYTMPPLTLNTLCNLEDALGFGIDQLQTQFNTKMATTLRSFLFALLKENYPDMTLEGTGRLVTADKLKPIVDLITSTVGGLR